MRKEAKREAAAVGRLARKLGIAHRTLRWTGAKPKTGLQEAARVARYRLLAGAAREANASHILTAHTRDDQAETVLIRMSRGSGITGLAAMARISAVPGDGEGQIKLVRPLLDIPKARLIATLRAAKIAFADDPSNRDPRFTRARLRGLMSELAREGLDSRRLALLARRLKRADQAIDAVVDRAVAELTRLSPSGDAIAIDAAAYSGLPAEIALRLLGRAVDRVGRRGAGRIGQAGSAENGARCCPKCRQRAISAQPGGGPCDAWRAQITVERAPPRRGRPLTTRRRGNAKPTKSR